MENCGLILTLGKSSEHVKTSLLRYSPKHLIIITSKEFATISKKRLSYWKKQFDLDGDVFIIDNLFSQEGGQEIMKNTLFAIDLLSFLKCDPILLGITGGTAAMAAVAASIASIAGIPIFYVKQPEKNQVIQPMKDVYQFPNVNAFRSISAMPLDAIHLLMSSFKKEDEEQRGILHFEDFRSIDMPVSFLHYLIKIDVLKDVGKDQFKITYTGFSVLKLVVENPNIGEFLQKQFNNPEKIDTMFM